MEGCRSAILRNQRELVWIKYSSDKDHRVKWLIELDDIDDELEELMRMDGELKNNSSGGQENMKRT